MTYDGQDLVLVGAPLEAKMKTKPLRIQRKSIHPRSTPRLTWVWVAAWVVFVLGAGITLSIVFWDWLGGEESGSTTIRNLGLVIAATVGLPIAIWRSIVAQRQVETAQRQAETAQRGLLNERYQKGAEMLGSEVLPVRLGGIHALARLAREHPGEYHSQIMSLLCAFACDPPELKKETRGEELRADVQNIMEAIAARNQAQIDEEDHILELSGAFLDEASLADGNLSGLFLDHVSLKGAFLYGANLSGARMGGAFLEGADLASANLAYAQLHKADLTDASLYRADLNNADLSDANLTGADLRKANLGAAYLKGCKGLTQERIDQAVAHSTTPPDFAGVVDAYTGKPLVWRSLQDQ